MILDFRRHKIINYLYILCSLLEDVFTVDDISKTIDLFHTTESVKLCNKITNQNSEEFAMCFF